jgi:hypothetical protein
MKIDLGGEKLEVVRVMSSNLVDQYEVTIKGGVAIRCTCKGFGYRGKCRHQAEGEALCEGS